jgi:RNA polymerase sigma-70 factor (ECF subfamily)
VLCDVEEFTYKEIAAALKIPVGTVMSRLHRGRAHLRSELEGLRQERPVDRRESTHADREPRRRANPPRSGFAGAGLD